MASRVYRHPSKRRFSLPAILFALSDETRLAIVAALIDGAERTVDELRSDISKSTMSYHTRVLREAGLTRTRSEGIRCFVSLRRADVEERFPRLLDVILGLSDRSQLDEPSI